VLRDALGREVLRIDAKSDGTALIPVRGSAALASGVYLVHLKDPEGDAAVRRLAITR